MVLRDLTTLSDLRRVVELEKAIWSDARLDDLAGIPILAVTVRRGGILIGAFDERDVMVGFVYSLPAVRDGRPGQWSHMLGVLPEQRNAGVGYLLKLEQRARVLALGLDLIEWTYDPLQARNAHMNFNKLGTVVGAYEPDFYGEPGSPRHRGGATDRFVAEWWVRRPEVERRLAGEVVDGVPAGAAAAAPVASTMARAAKWWRCTGRDLALDAPVVAVDVPMGFTEMQAREPDIAREWRLATREIFLAYFARDYRATAFALDRERGAGRYLLTRRS